MYRREKPPRDDLLNHHKSSRKTHHQNMPSFSSTLLDEIYRSIDSNVDKDTNKPVKKQSSFRAKGSSNNGGGKSTVEDEEVANLRRVKDWVEKEAVEKKKKHLISSSLLVQDNDVLFFSSASSSSDSSGQLSSSSDTEFFGTNVPKPIRTGSVSRKQQEDAYMFDEYKNQENKNANIHLNKNKSKKKMDAEEEEFMKSKSRALKIYANLKKMKQPISPGGKLTTFINSLFTTAKKTKNADTVVRKSATTTCSSATSFSRSCLTKCSPRSKEGIQRTVRFHPVNVIVDEDSRRKCVVDEDVERHGRPPLPPNAIAEMKQSLREKNRRIEEAAQKVLQGYNRKNKDEFSIFRKIHREEEEEDEDDAMSDCSSDLFELDHLATFSNNRYCEELPVYETTHLSTNRGITARLVR